MSTRGRGKGNLTLQPTQNMSSSIEQLTRAGNVGHLSPTPTLPSRPCCAGTRRSAEREVQSSVGEESQTSTSARDLGCQCPSARVRPFRARTSATTVCLSTVCLSPAANTNQARPTTLTSSAVKPLEYQSQKKTSVRRFGVLHAGGAECRHAHCWRSRQCSCC